jgi:hypothetical protein
MSDLHLNGFGVNPIVLGVRADEFHVDGLEAICHRDHQAIFIALNIEDDRRFFRMLALRYCALMAAG